MKQIQIIDPTTLEVANYIETNFWHDGTPMTPEKCDNVLYREFECGVFYKRQISDIIRISWYRHLMIDNDVSDIINSAIDCAPAHTVLDGENGFFNVHSIWLKSNISFKNFNLKSIGTDETDISVICIGNDIDPASIQNPFSPLKSKYAKRVFDRHNIGETNIEIENVHIDGNREAHTMLAYKDGGRHGISIKGKVSRIRIKNCSAQFCATDGLQIYRGLAYAINDDAIFAATDIQIENLICEWNRRHGASGDSINILNVQNSKFNRNGRDVNGANVEGNEGCKNSNDELYGNGWDMEGYGVGSNVHNITFNNCEFIENVKAGLLMYEAATGQEATFVKRSNIYINSCKFDCGLINSEFTAVDITGPQAYIQPGTFLYDQIIFDNCYFVGRFLGKSIKNLTIRNCYHIYVPADTFTTRGLVENVELAMIRNVQTKRHLWSGQNFNIISDDILVKSVEVNFGQINSGTLQTIDIPFPEAEFGDIITITLNTINEIKFREFTLGGLVAYPGNKVLVTIKNNSNNDEIVPLGNLHIFVEKKFISK
jgi:hypothetical protein